MGNCQASSRARCAGLGAGRSQSGCSLGDEGLRGRDRHGEHWGKRRNGGGRVRWLVRGSGEVTSNGVADWVLGRVGDDVEGEEVFAGRRGRRIELSE